ncbi:MAG: 2-oxoglutarate dehydrogenase E1 component [Verrucomicrobia bacterium]|nr:2-oxoglutarate dehydrogenase E1 component [Verrucomicrobiota bacterium]
MATTLPHRPNIGVLETNYERWRQNPTAVDPVWSAFFEGFELGNTSIGSASVPDKSKSTQNGANGAPIAGGFDQQWQAKVDRLVLTYRSLGHLKAHTNPLSPTPPESPLLALETLGFSQEDLSRDAASLLFRNGQQFKLSSLIAALESIYCRHIGAEFAHIENPAVREWVREKYEAAAALEVPAETQLRMIQQILSVESFEKFLHTRFVGQKRFSIEGGESLIVALYGILESAPQHRVEEIVMGMAHRGRLSVINEFLQKPISVMFAQFSENYMPDTVAGDGDVKYHLGYKTKRQLPGGYEVSVRLASNPSHLEAVNPVVQGMTRARQHVRGDSSERKRVVAVLVHGDAAFAGQGVVAECLNMSQLEGYRVGGTIHIVVNNQIGFTTLPADARSSRYCTDVAKLIGAPVFHINGDDPVAVRVCAELAMEYRQKFNSDVILDIVCYRRHGHNEGDEPVFTQPVMYRKISAHSTLGTLFRQELLGNGILSTDAALDLDRQFQARYESAFAEVKAAEQDKQLDKFSHSNVVFQPAYSHDPVNTAISKASFDHIFETLTTVPESFSMLPRLKKVTLEKRRQAWKQGGPFDWAMGEALAFGSLLIEGSAVRLSGQDCRRGTFSHRHAVLYDENTRDRYIPLQHLAPDQGRFNVYNSLLSEAAVLGFDYGYTLHFPSMLCLWEAQFGDFSNGAQIIIDQFIAAGESKWQRPSGIVLLLPHGYEGQGPEHSSGRLERFLQLCAEENMQVCNFTTPAQYFHALRRQMKRPFRKPLVVMTPKSLLRAPECVSVEADFTAGAFEEILPGPLEVPANKVSRVVLCSGKVYYDLLKQRDAAKTGDVALVRIEQLYPLHTAKLAAVLKAYTKAKTFVWCQEEPANMGAWSHLRNQLSEIVGKPLLYAGREAAASPAVGALALHKIEQQQLVEAAFTVV